MVASNYRLEGGFEEIKRLCYAGLDEISLMEQALERLRRLIPFEAYCVHRDDPYSGLMTRVTTDGIFLTEGLHSLYMQQVYFEEDYFFMREMARGGAPAVSLSQLTYGKLERALHYRVINHPLGLEHELLSVCASGRDLWGGMGMKRARGRPDFDEREIRLVRQIAPHLGAGLKMASLRVVAVASQEDDAAPGVLVLDEHVHVVQHTEAAERWLRELPDFGPRWQDGEGLPTPVWMVIGALRRALSPDTDAQRYRVPHILAQTRSGRWLTLHGSLPRSVDGARGQTVVIIEPSRPRELAWLRGSAYGLSERERDVVELVVLGASTKDISRQLCLSGYTVQEHLSHVYDKVGVRGRTALVKRLYFDQVVPGLMTSNQHAGKMLQPSAAGG